MMDKFDHPLGDTEKVVNKFTGECIQEDNDDDK
jgi:hypothetical protein